MHYLLLFVGLLLIVKSADVLIDSSTKIARRYGISTFIIGVTVVAFGTSAPELAVGIVSGIAKTNQLTLGNIIGSTFANSAMIIGITALVMPIAVNKSIIRRELPLLLIIQAALLAMMLLGGGISRIDSLILLAGFGIFMSFVIRDMKKSASVASDELLTPCPDSGDTNSNNNKPADTASAQLVTSDCAVLTTEASLGNETALSGTDTAATSKQSGMLKLWLLAIVGLAGLFLGGKLTVDNSTLIAESLGLDSTLIGLTVVAIATTIPELVTSITAAIKKEPDLVLGNCIGSNIFNILFVIGTSAMINPIKTPEKIWFDVVLSTIITLSLLLISLKFKKIHRSTGFILIGIYISFLVFKILTI